MKKIVLAVLLLTGTAFAGDQPYWMLSKNGVATGDYFWDFYDCAARLEAQITVEQGKLQNKYRPLRVYRDNAPRMVTLYVRDVEQPLETLYMACALKGNEVVQVPQAVPVQNNLSKNKKENWHKLELGMTLAQVEALLGKPDHVSVNGEYSREWRYNVPGKWSRVSFERKMVHKTVSKWYGSFQNYELETTYAPEFTVYKFEF